MKNGRDYRVVEDIATIKERNAVVRELEADGWNAQPGGSKRSGYRVSAWKGERPVVIRMTIHLGRDHVITPLYRRDNGDGFEFADGTPEYEA